MSDINIKSKNIIYYQDYRDFLADQFEKNKQRNKNISYAAYAMKLGSTKSYLKLLSQKKRHSSLDRIVKISVLFKLSNIESQYLIFLFLYQTTKEAEIKSYFKKILYNLKDRVLLTERLPELSLPTPVLNVEPSSNNGRILYKTWTHLAVYTMVKLKDFNSDPIWIAKKLSDPNVTPKLISQIINELTEHGFLQMKNGQLTQANSKDLIPYFADPEEYKACRSVLTRAMQTLNDTHRHRSFCIQATAFAMSEENGRKAIDLYQNLFTQLRALEDTSRDPEAVLFVSNNIFNVVPRQKDAST